MKAIYKYLLKMQNKVEIVMPKDAQILHVHTQGGDIFVWALVDPKQLGDETRFFEIYGTGHPFDTDGLRYVGTAHIEGAASRLSWVWHVFERPVQW